MLNYPSSVWESIISLFKTYFAIVFETSRVKQKQQLYRMCTIVKVFNCVNLRYIKLQQEHVFIYYYLPTTCICEPQYFSTLPYVKLLS